MTSKPALAAPLRITCTDDEVVFLGLGSVNFSMTEDAARKTLDALTIALKPPEKPRRPRP